MPGYLAGDELGQRVHSAFTPLRRSKAAADGLVDLSVKIDENGFDGLERATLGRVDHHCCRGRRDTS